MNKFSKTVLFILLFVAWVAMSMQRNAPSGRKATRIYEEYADSTVFERFNNPDIHILRGNVVFRHDSTYMYCDSAYYYQATNSLEAFSNVRIEQGDTLFIYGDYMMYDGNESMAKMRDNVRMVNNSLTLFTDNFNFDRIRNIGYFFSGGMLVDSLNELTSVYGQYSPGTKIATFKEDVHLENPQFLLTTDTLLYHTVTKIASIVSPTVITSDSGVIYSNRGRYNTVSDEAILLNRSIVFNKERTQTMTADSLFYNRQTGFGEAFRHMELNDTDKKILLTGNYGYFDQKTQFAFATDSAQMIEYSQQDSLFLHADTLQMQTIDAEKELKAFHNVRFYRTDLQGVCDSMRFHTRDSILYLYENPILWNTDYQLTGDTIHILFNDSTVERIKVLKYAFALQETDSSYYNQLKGKNLYAYFTAGELNKIDIEGNAESIYYPIEEGGTSLIGQNRTQSSFMAITIKNRKPTRIVWRPQPQGELLPIPDLTPEKKYLQDFVDYQYLRPKDRLDIFTKTMRKTEDIPAQHRQRRKR
ncbi:MAG: hypothetical protein LBN18_07805 [Dysgonamonadaceae bacterium]|nr:hypothetical protein [Dysgonamonadaceae bacterium]